MPKTTAKSPPPSQSSAAEDEAPPIDELVRRYLDLYQESWVQGLADPRLVEVWLGLARPVVEVWRDAASALRTPHGTEAAASPPSDGADDVGELRRRVADLERRIARLERTGDSRSDGGVQGAGGAGKRAPRASGGTGGVGRKRTRS